MPLPYKVQLKSNLNRKRKIFYFITLYKCMKFKKCPRCEKEKLINEFYKNKKRVHSWCKKCLCENQKERWTERKIEAMKLFGSKCSKCGYCKNFAALEFHHTNPKEKVFSWNQTRELAWIKIIEELKKCVLLCSNCHREQHCPSAVFEKYKILKIKTHLNREEITPTGNCTQCGVDVYGTKYCSVLCSTFSKRKVERPSKKELQKLLDENAYVKVASMYGVSDNAIRKWAKQYDLLK